MAAARKPARKPATKAPRPSAAAKLRAAQAKAKEARETCALRVSEKSLRADHRRAQRLALTLTRQHAAALAKLTAARGGCAHGCKKTRRAECMAAPAVKLLARRLAEATTAAAKLAERHTQAAEQLRKRGVEVLALAPVAPPAPRRRDGGPSRSSCGTVCHIQVRDGVCGGQATILLPAAQGAPREVPTRYCMVEASQLITSHRPTDFSVDPRYPANTQERRYDRDPAEQMKVVQIAQNPRPELVISTAASPLDGTPVATTTGIVLGGNGRTMGMKRHYLMHGTAFRDYLRKNAHEFGFTAAQVDKFDQPIIVRTIDPPPAEYVRLVRDLNQTLTQSMDVIAEGVSLARQMPAAALEILAQSLGSGDTELGEYFSSRASLPFIAALERGGIITAQNRGRLVRTDGLLTDDGRALAIRQIGASILPDADLLERMGAELRQALARSAPFWLAAAASGDAWDVRPALASAVRDLLAARAADLSPRRFFQQVDFFNPPASHNNPMALRMLVLLDKLGGKPAVLGRVAKYYASEAAQHGRQATLLAPVSPPEALDQAAGSQAKLDLAREIGALR